VPYPADEIGKPKPDAGARPGSPVTSPASAGSAATRAQAIIPDDATPEAGPGQSTSASVFETASSAFETASSAFSSTLDRGRQAWRQALTGPNNWLSARTSSSASTSSPAPAGYTGSATETGNGYTSAGSYGSTQAPGAPAASPDTASSGYNSTDYSSYSGATGYSAPASSGASYGGPAAATAPVGTSSGSGIGSGSPWASAGAAAAGAAAGAGAAYSGATRPSAASPATETSWRPRATVTATKGKNRKNSRRQAQLTLSRVEPWSVMKFSFVVSVVAFIVLFVAVAVLYMVLSSLGVFESLQHTVNNLTSAKNQAGTNVSSWFSASRILGYTGMLGALNIVLITAISTIGAVIYNLIAQTIGGIEVTLRETD